MEKVSLPQPTPNLSTAILGSWKLKSRQDVDNNGQIHFDPFMGENPLGIICFAPGYFSAQFMKRERGNMENSAPRTKTENNSAAINGYDGYFGTCSVDETAGTLTTTIEGSISPDNIGSTYVREVRVLDDKLIIQLNTIAVDNTEVTRTNTFIRIREK